ncbi:MAG: XTP/dITP diphosphatase [Deltaproteobacteria bacterium]|nr:XTP/dITP diphosphatase [Deltaproteobacteria bacterium]
MDIILATNNQHKLEEFKDILQDGAVSVQPLSAYPDCPAMIEDGSTFIENALIKARIVAAHTGHVTMADDSGLEVDALDGAPGIYSARYAGEDATDATNNEKLLQALDALPPAKRGAQFRCVIALVDPASGKEEVVEGLCRGGIITEQKGSCGFGYDPLFRDPASGLTFAEMGPEQKNNISHRSCAIRELKKILPDFLRK